MATLHFDFDIPHHLAIVVCWIERHLPAAVALHPDAGRAIRRPPVARHGMVSAHDRGIAKHPELHRCDFGDEGLGVDRPLPLP